MIRSYYDCSCCGKRILTDQYRTIKSPIVVKMLEARLCFDCAYWKNWLENPEANTVVISGSVYKVTGKFFTPSRRQARSKSIYFLYDVKDQEPCACTDLLFRGRIPEPIQKDLPDQYKLITRDEYIRLTTYEAECCLSKGCFDRYHCVWYNAQIAEPDGPWNKIPRRHTIGSEDCPSFVNKNELRNND